LGLSHHPAQAFQTPFGGRGSASLWLALPSRYALGADARFPWKAAPTVLLNSVVICFAFLAVSPNLLVKKDPMEVSPFSRGTMLQPLSASLQDGLRFFHLPMPTILSAPLTVGFPLRENDGVTPFRIRTHNGWVRLRRFAGGIPSAAREKRPLALSHSPFGSNLLCSAPLACWA